MDYDDNFQHHQDGHIEIEEKEIVEPRRKTDAPIQEQFSDHAQQINKGQQQEMTEQIINKLQLIPIEENTKVHLGDRIQIKRSQKIEDNLEALKTNVACLKRRNGKKLQRIVQKKKSKQFN
ncbi:hypothetical protein pb186bvf_021167 [Paramecium bursaria]